MKTRFLELATALLLLAPAIGTRADTSFAYQGRLLNEKGQMLGENQRHHSIKFSIYDLASGGEPLWNCTRDVYLSSDGQFSVELSGNSVSGGTLGALFAANVDKTLYIGLTVGDGAEIAPRRKTIIKLLSLLITESSRHSEECLLLQAIQDNSAHFESKAASFPLIATKVILLNFCDLWCSE